MTKTIAQMTANEYREFLLNNPEEAKKLDEVPEPPKGTIPTGLWRNGIWVEIPGASPEQPQ